jgi:chaperone modulatory protein CbpM
MSQSTTTLVLLDDAASCSAEQLAQMSGLSLDDLALLVEHGLILPLGGGPGAGMRSDAPAAQPAFILRTVVVAHAARRLREDFELDRNGWLLAVRLWQRLQETEAELRSVRASLSRFLGA